MSADLEPVEIGTDVVSPMDDEDAQPQQPFLNGVELSGILG